MIREAETGDRKSIQRLYEILCPNEQINVLAERIDQIKEDLNNYLFVYEEDSQILGTVFITICLDVMFGFQPYAVLENIIVQDSVRGRGIGKKLLEHIEHECRKLHCTKIMLLSNINRIEAHEFFEKNGYDGTVSKGFKKYLNNDKRSIL
jgi:N-acetylglutamate synthase-like GNAT family acetyltransferase